MTNPFAGRYEADILPMMDALHELFNANQKEGRVRMDYTTQIYFGQLDPRSGARPGGQFGAIGRSE